MKKIEEQEEQEVKSLIGWFIEDLGKYSIKLVLLYYITILVMVFIGLPYSILTACAVVSLVLPEVNIVGNTLGMVIIAIFVVWVSWCICVQKMWNKKKPKK